jgi:hypothetical protein
MPSPSGWLAVDLIGDDLQPMARQVEEAEDLGPQQAAT